MTKEELKIISTPFTRKQKRELKRAVKKILKEEKNECNR